MINKNNSKIGDNANDNIVLQDSSVSGSVINGPAVVINGPIVIDSMDNVLPALVEEENYSTIQDLAKIQFEAFEKAHPLYPDFSAEFDTRLKRLISTPQTDDALKKYPRKLRGTYKIDINDFPGMDSSETILEYAYRTQQKLELEPSSYQEYLGDEPDPYPGVEYYEGMKMILYPPKFPEAIDCTIISDDISLPLKLQRIPCLQFGVAIFEGTPIDHSISLTLKHNQVENKFTANIKCNLKTSLSERLTTEKFLNGILKTKKFTIQIEDSPLCTMMIDDESIDEASYAQSSYLIRFIENLLKIQEATECKFDSDLREVLVEDYNTAMIMARSIQGEWCGVKKEFDNEVRSDYDRIPENLINLPSPDFENLVAENQEIKIQLQGQTFIADKFIVVYRHAKINNLKSVRKNYYKKRTGIMITIKPQEGEDVFYKYSKYENLTVSPN